MNASQPAFAEIIDNVPEALYWEILHQKMASGRKDAMTLLKREPLLGAENYKVKAPEDTDGVRKLMTAVLDSIAHSTFLKKICLPQARKELFVTKKVAHVVSAKFTRPELREVVQLEV